VAIERITVKGVAIAGTAVVALGLSMLVVLFDYRAAHAESLFDRTRCLVRGMLSRECQPAPSPILPQKVQPDASHSSSPPVQSPEDTPPPVEAEAPIVTGALLLPIEFNETLRQPLPERLRYSGSATASSGDGSIKANVFSIAGGRTEVLGAMDTATPLAASQQGWMIVGLAWYWWVGIIAAVAGVILAGRQLILRRNVNIVARGQ
jgi:hypothetical protein